MPAPDPKRLALLEEQARLVRALMHQGEPPHGFDVSRLEIASASLVNKRLRESARAWPALARCLGEGYAERFRAFARVAPPPAEGGPLADGYAFFRTLNADALDDDARREAMLVELHWRPTRGGLRPRRGFALRWGRRVVGVCLPWLGVRLFRF